MWNKLKTNSLFRFLVVGALGTILNLLVFFILSDFAKINHNIASATAFAIAVTQNYSLNEIWSFALLAEKKLNLKRYAVYLFGNLLGLLVNLALLNFLLISFHWELKTMPQAISIAVATIINFIWAKLVVFRKRIR